MADTLVRGDSRQLGVVAQASRLALGSVEPAEPVGLVAPGPDRRVPLPDPSGPIAAPPTSPPRWRRRRAGPESAASSSRHRSAWSALDLLQAELARSSPRSRRGACGTARRTSPRRRPGARRSLRRARSRARRAPRAASAPRSGPRPGSREPRRDRGRRRSSPAASCSPYRGRSALRHRPRLCTPGSSPRSMPTAAAAARRRLRRGVASGARRKDR